jgi:hypothetical protein
VAPKWLTLLYQKTLNNYKKNIFFGIFPDCLPQVTSRWPQDGPKMAPRWPQDGARWPQAGPTWLKMAPSGPKMAPRWPQDGLNHHRLIATNRLSIHNCFARRVSSHILMHTLALAPRPRLIALPLSYTCLPALWICRLARLANRTWHGLCSRAE